MVISGWTVAVSVRFVSGRDGLRAPHPTSTTCNLLPLLSPSSLPPGEGIQSLGCHIAVLILGVFCQGDTTVVTLCRVHAPRRLE